MMNKRVGAVRPIPLVIALAMFGCSVQGAYFASQLTPPRKAEVWFPSNHMLSDLSEFMGKNFYQPSYDNYAVISLFWGVQGFDDTTVDIYHPDSTTGMVRFDPAFDLSTATAQQAVLDTCQKLRTMKCVLAGCDNAGYDTLRYQSTMKSHACFLEDFRHWNGGTIPTGDAFEPRLLEFQQAGLESDYYDDLLGGDIDYAADIGFVDGKLRYVVIKIRSTMPREAPYSKGVEIQDMLREWNENALGEMPASLKSMKFVAEDIFRRYDLASELLSSLFSGCAIAAPMSFLVLILSTKNIIVAVYAVYAVASIVFCVLGFCKSAMNWDLGVGEAIAGVIVIGYSVDYVVHLAHIYCEARHHGAHTRADRAQFALRNMGSTVFAGAITTAGSGAIMFLCFFYFFFKMALLITVTIAYSFLFSLGFFMSMVWLIGPEGSFGDIPTPKFIERRLTSVIAGPSGGGHTEPSAPAVAQGPELVGSRDFNIAEYSAKVAKEGRLLPASMRAHLHGLRPIAAQIPAATPGGDGANASSLTPSSGERPPVVLSPCCGCA